MLTEEQIREALRPLCDGVDVVLETLIETSMDEYRAIEQAVRKEMEGYSERLDWLDDQTREQLRGVSLTWSKYSEDGHVLEKGYRVISRAVQSDHQPTLRAAIDAARGQT